MKTRSSRVKVFLSVGAASLLALGVTAQTPTPEPTATPTSPASDPAPAKWPYGVEDVVKLSRAQISEDITLNYVQNSGTIYSLAPRDIVALRNEGVSDKVINAMLDQRKNVPADVANQNALQAQAAMAGNTPTFASADASSPQAAPIYGQPAPVYVQPVPVPVYVQPEPDYVPASTLYVIPYGPSGFSYCRYPSGFFGCSYGHASSVYSIGTGYGSGRYYGGARYYGGHYGGGRRSGVYHFGRR
jgi:hypothetical protein